MYFIYLFLAALCFATTRLLDKTVGLARGRFYFISVVGKKKETKMAETFLGHGGDAGERKTCIIDNDMVRVPFGQQLFS